MRSATPTPEFIEEKLHEENRNLSLREFYSKYETEFRSYTKQKIILTFEGDTLVTASGDRHEPFPWLILLERKLNNALNDQVKANAVTRSYLKHIQPLIEDEPALDETFQWFLESYAFYLGGDPIWLKRKMLIYGELKPFFNNKELVNAFDNFAQELADQFRRATPADDGVQKIAVITGPYGGGHVSTAAAITSTLVGTPLRTSPEKPIVRHGSDQTEVVLIDECLMGKDRLSQITGTRSCQVYNEIFIKEDNVRKATLLWILNDKLGEYVADNRYHEIYQMMRQESPDLIISTVHHVNPVTSLPYLLDIPLSIYVTDYDFPKAQWPYLNHEDQRLITYWVPATHRNFFRQMIRYYYLAQERWDPRLKHSRTHRIYQKLFVEQNKLGDIFPSLEVFEVLPFPVSPIISPPMSRQDSLESRKYSTAKESLELSDNPDRKIVAISFGGAGNPRLVVDLIQKIANNAEKIKFPIQLAILSGNNELLIEQAKATLDNLKISSHESENAKITAKILGFLSNPVGMSHLYKSADLVIGKSGGATTAEILNSYTYFMRGFPLWRWELENEQLLEKVNLAPRGPSKEFDSLKYDLSSYMVDPEIDDLIKGINTMLSKPRMHQIDYSLFSAYAGPFANNPTFEGDQLKYLIQKSIDDFSFLNQRLIKGKETLANVIAMLKALPTPYEIFDHNPLDDNESEGNLYKFLDRNGGEWSVQILKNAGIPSLNHDSPKGSLWPDEVIGLNAAKLRIRNEKAAFDILAKDGEIAPLVIKSQILSDFATLKPLVPGTSLQDAIEKGTLTEDMGQALSNVLILLSSKSLYLKNIFGSNIVFNHEQGQWIIVGNDGLEQKHTSPCDAYYRDFSDSWKAIHFENTDSKNELESVKDSLLYRLHDSSQCQK